MSKEKQFLYGTDAWAARLAGAEKLERAVRSTFGPKGRNVLIQKFGAPLITKDGVTVSKNVELSNELPTIKMRTNGFSFGNIKKGFFNLDKFGKSRLLIHSDLFPYLILTKNNGDKIIINFKDKIETEKSFDNIKTMINK